MDEKYFENLASGKKADFEITDNLETEDGASAKESDTTAIDAIAHEMGNYGVELARANSSTVASRPASATARGHAKSTRMTAASTGTTPEKFEAKPEAKAEAWNDGESEGQLTLDVYQTPADIVIESAIAGVRPEDIDITVTTDSISIKGVRQREEEVGNEDYLYRECYWGRFGRSIILPQEVDPERAEVTFRNGILIVRLPKVNRQKSRKLRVRFD